MAMKLFVKLICILIVLISFNLAVYPYQACAAHQTFCLCCNKNICTCDANCSGTDKSLNGPGHTAKRGHCGFKHGNNCQQKQNTQESFLITDASSELKKKPVLFASHTILPDNIFVLGVNTEASLYNQHLLSSSSLFLINESLRL
jgi:hypothetical protein